MAASHTDSYFPSTSNGSKLSVASDLSVLAERGNFRSDATRTSCATSILFECYNDILLVSPTVHNLNYHVDWSFNSAGFISSDILSFQSSRIRSHNFLIRVLCVLPENVM
jgi:hypothetical protein